MYIYCIFAYLPINIYIKTIFSMFFFTDGILKICVFPRLFLYHSGEINMCAFKLLKNIEIATDRYSVSVLLFRSNAEYSKH